MVIIIFGVSGSGKTSIFMSPKLLLSQRETLEEPTPTEATIVRVQTETSSELIALYIHNKLKHL